MKTRMSNGITETAQAALANKAAVTSGVVVGASWVLEMGPYLQVIATLVAIVAGGAAAWYHIERGIYMHGKNHEED